MKVYFIDDPEDPGWKVVRYKDPSSRRVTGGLQEASLSAHGRPDATFSVNSVGGRDQSVDPVSEPVLEVDVEHVMAHEEADDNLAYDDVDHHDDLSEYDEGDLEQINTSDTPIHDIIDDR